jgi:hypothetical protein
MTESASVTRVTALMVALAAFVLGIAVMVVTSAAPTSAGQPRPPGVPPAPAIGGADVLTYDLSGLPEGTVLVVQQRLGTKGSYVEVGRSTKTSGAIEVGRDSASRALLRLTLISDSGVVLMQTERQL